MQSAANRDDYVIINWDNILKKRTQNFKKYNTLNFNISYDFGSIMHNGPTAFAKDKRKRTIGARESYIAPGMAMGQRSSLSPQDILKLNAMYKCEISTTKPTFNVTEASGGCSTITAIPYIPNSVYFILSIFAQLSIFSA